MPTVAELTAVYGNFMLGPRRGPNVCHRCFNFTAGYTRCYACTHSESWLDAICPISYSIAREQLHHVLRGYKRCAGGATARRFSIELAAVLWRHLIGHERCVAHAAQTDAFDLVATVPSGDRDRDACHPLRRIVGELAAPTRGREERLLRRSARTVNTRAFDAGKYEAARALRGEAVLLIDDTWTTGANAQSCAATLKAAGSGPVAVVVIGRHLNREWRENDRRLRGISTPFDWSRCAVCASEESAD